MCSPPTDVPSYTASVSTWGATHRILMSYRTCYINSQLLLEGLIGNDQQRIDLRVQGFQAHPRLPCEKPGTASLAGVTVPMTRDCAPRGAKNRPTFPPQVVCR
jgi:hypothetical protein